MFLSFVETEFSNSIDEFYKEYSSEGSLIDRIKSANERKERGDREMAFTKMRCYMENLKAKDHVGVREILMKCIGIKELT